MPEQRQDNHSESKASSLTSQPANVEQRKQAVDVSDISLSTYQNKIAEALETQQLDFDAQTFYKVDSGCT